MAIPYVPGYSGHTQGPNGTVTRLVLHGTVGPTSAGSARGVAGYFQSPNSGGLAHYVGDAADIVACCPEDTACWHAPPNPGSIGFEFCDIETGDPSRWQDADHQSMLRLAAPLIRDICVRHNLPMVYVDHNGLLAGQRGITTHYDVSQAWHQSDHSDPTGFPMAQFLAMVNGSTPTSGGFLMSLSDAEQAELLTRVRNIPGDVWTVPRIDFGPAQVSQQPPYALLATASSASLTASALAGKSGAVDVTALAAQIVAQLPAADVAALAAKLQVTVKP